MNQNNFVQYMDTKLGKLEICASEQGITAIRFIEKEIECYSSNHHTQEAVTQLAEYLAGNRQTFDLSLTPQGTTFQKSVWEQLLAIPYGQTCSYADIATRINNPKAVRAVGAANGRNPITIIVPCHRVVGSNGKLTGYAWGTSIKAELLLLESS